MSNVCPHCGEARCLPVWRKLRLGPSGSARCLACDCKVGLAFGPAMASRLALGLLAMLFLLLVLLRLALASPAPDTVPVAAILGILALLLLAAALHHTHVPLRVDELSNAAIVAEGKARVASRRG